MFILYEELIWRARCLRVTFLFIGVGHESRKLLVLVYIFIAVRHEQKLPFPSWVSFDRAAAWSLLDEEAGTFQESSTLEPHILQTQVELCRTHQEMCLYAPERHLTSNNLVT